MENSFQLNIKEENFSKDDNKKNYIYKNKIYEFDLIRKDHNLVQ